MIDEAPPAEDGNRMCPKCGEYIDGKFCSKCNVRTIGEKSPLAIYRELREEEGKKPFGGLFEKAIFGYDLRFRVPEVKKILVEELPLYFYAYEIFTKAKIAILSGDHRNGREIINMAFEKYCRERANGECMLIDGISTTTMAPFISALISFQAKKKIVNFHATASHNPPEYNGIKVFYGKFEKDIFPEKMEIEERIKAEEGARIYADFVLQRATKFDEPFFFDFMNGAGWEVMKYILPRISSKVQVLNKNPLKDFGGKKAEPPLEHEGNFGFCADGDMDRIAMYYRGKIVPFSQFLAISAELGIFNEKVVVDQPVSPLIVDFLRDRGINVIVGDVGRTMQEKIAKEHNAMWTEENWHSGGYMINGERLYWGEAPLGFVQWLRIIGSIGVERFFKTDVPKPILLTQKMRAFPGINEKIVEIARKYFKDVQEIKSGGVRIELGSGHILIRESNTEIGVCRVYATGISKEEAEKNLREGIKLVNLISR